MELELYFHMKDDDDEINYANHSLLQRTVISMVKPILEESLVDLYCRLSPECLRVADLGCSAGPNTLLVLSEIVDVIADTCRNLKLKAPCVQAFLNDLYGNDFNSVFRSLPRFYKRLEEEDQFGTCFVSAMPGSFYGRLFPDNSLHFVHSNYAIMWLSKVPKELVSGEAVNKGNICLTKTSPPTVFRAYFEQFQRDFTHFLKCRAKELVPGGSMVLTKVGCINNTDPLSIWEVLGFILNDMVLEGMIEEKTLESFNLPHYTATEEEVRNAIEEEGSFTLHRLESLKMDWDGHIKRANVGLCEHERAKRLAHDMRVVVEPILGTHFVGHNVMDELFRRFRGLVLGYMVAHKCQFVTLVMCLTRN